MQSNAVLRLTPLQSSLSLLLILGSFGNENAKKAMGLLSKTTTLHVHHAILYISLPSLHDYGVKMPDFTLYGGRKQATMNFFLFLTRVRSPRNQPREIRLNLIFLPNWNKHDNV